MGNKHKKRGDAYPKKRVPKYLPVFLHCSKYKVNGTNLPFQLYTPRLFTDEQALNIDERLDGCKLPFIYNSGQLV